MTPERLKEIEELAHYYLTVDTTSHDGIDPETGLELIAEVRRLCDLVKNAEHNGENGFCPWCHRTELGNMEHVDCPAFASEGVLK